MAATATPRPSHIPVSSSQPPRPRSPTPPSPSAFPSIDGSAVSAPSIPAVLPPSNLPSYARATGKVLPPTSAPEGVSLAPQPKPERLQPSAGYGKGSPYARPTGSTASGNRSGAAAGARGKTKSATKADVAARKAREDAERINAATASGPAPAKDTKPRVVPGMPASMLPTRKKGHARAKSDGGASLQASIADGHAGGVVDQNVIPTVGKKKRQTLRKVLPPSLSKLSAAAPTFEFIPRSATLPSLSSHAASSSSDNDQDHDTDPSPAPTSDAGSTESSPVEQSEALTPSFKELKLEAEDELEDGEIREEKLPEPSASAAQVEELEEGEIVEPLRSGSLVNYLSSAFTSASSGAFPPLSSFPSASSSSDSPALVDPALAAQTISSSGPQADGFVGQSLTQSESDMRPDADKTGVTTIPGTVNGSAVAELMWREKRGWWQDDWDPSSDVEQEEQKEEEIVEPIVPAAIEAEQEKDYTPLLQFPPWTPSPPTSAAAADSQPISAIIDPASIVPLSRYLPTAFSAVAEAGDLPTSVEAIVSSQPPLSSSSPAPAPPSSSSLSSFLGGSFTHPATGGWSPLALDEQRAELLAQEHKTAVDMPLSAEEVVNQPTLDDALDVDGIEGGQVVNAAPEEEKKSGWWSEDYDPSKVVDQDLARDTVQNAGAQADGFVVKGFTAADGEGASMEAEAPKAAAQSAKEIQPVQEEDVVSRASTPLSAFLTSAFQPSDDSFVSHASPSSSAAVDPPSMVDQALARDSVSTAGAQADGLVGKSFTQADREGAVEAEGSRAQTPSAPDLSADSTSIPPPTTAAADVASADSPSTTGPTARRSSSPPPPPSQHNADDAPSLTLAIASAWHTAPWSKKLWAVFASVAINVGLPFINGVMLGFGELFARNVLGVRLGWPLHNPTSTTSAPGTRANTAGVGLRAAGSTAGQGGGGRGVGTDVPGHAGAKTAVEGIVEAAAE
ncbi:hypothetical protein JCM21900_005535 [Sporobolomyces salmonicolor]